MSNAVKLLVRRLTVVGLSGKVEYPEPMLLVGHGPEGWHPGSPAGAPVPFTHASLTPFTRETPGTLYLPSLTITLE